MEQNRLKVITNNPTQPLDVTSRSIGELLDKMLYTGFQGRKLAESVQVWNNMLKEKDITIMMGLTGAMIPAGMRKIIVYLIKNRIIDCLVSTGANIFHDCHEALGKKHYVGSHLVDDKELFKFGIDRIYDVFAFEEEFRNTDHFIANFAHDIDKKRISSRELMYLLGKKIYQSSHNYDESIVGSSYKYGVPIFVPALGDSSIGIGLTIARRNGIDVNIDQIKDVDEITNIVEKSGKTGVIYVGGGVPKNFIQQTEVVASIMGIENDGHDYAIQYTTDVPHWGGLSGCTFDEGVSWGKIAADAKKVQVFVDATIALPIVAHGINDKKFYNNRFVPVYEWDNKDGVKIIYKTL